MCYVHSMAENGRSVPAVDVRVENHGTVFLFDLRTLAARGWVSENVTPEVMYLDKKLAVDHRYARDLAAGMIADGLILE